MGVKVENLDHLGIVTGIIDDLGIEEQIDAAVGTAAQSKVSPGQAVKAMIVIPPCSVSGSTHFGSSGA